MYRSFHSSLEKGLLKGPILHGSSHPGMHCSQQHVLGLSRPRSCWYLFSVLSYYMNPNFSYSLQVMVSHSTTCIRRDRKALPWRARVAFGHAWMNELLLCTSDISSACSSVVRTLGLQ